MRYRVKLQAAKNADENEITVDNGPTTSLLREPSVVVPSLVGSILLIVVLHVP